MIKATTGLPAHGMSLHDCLPPHDAVTAARVAPAAQTAEGAGALYQLEYLDATGSAITEASFTAADAAIYLRSLLAMGVSPVTVRVIA